MIRKITFAILLAAVSCACERAGIGDENIAPPASGDDAPVRLTLKTDGGVRTSLDGTKIVWSAGDAIVVNGERRTVRVEGDEAYVLVPAADSYEAFYPADIVTESGIALQPAQFHAYGSFGCGANPMRGTGSGSELRFRSLCGVLKLTVAGSDRITSVAVEDRSGGALCGFFEQTKSGLALRSDSRVAQPAVVLNCTAGGGVRLDAAGTDFYVVMPPATYSDGLKITIGDDTGRAVVIDSKTPRTIKANDILVTPRIDYAPDDDLIFAEHFDKNAWGADRVSGGCGFKPTDSLAATGREMVTDVAEDYGTAAISTSWDAPQKNRMTESYIASRSLGEWQMLYSCMETFGALSVGSSAGRGFLRLPPLSNLKAGEVCKATMTFRVAFPNGAASDLLQIYPFVGGTGKILDCYVDGTKIDAPKNGDRWTAGTNIGLTATGMSQEKFLLYPSVDVCDNLWHTVRIDLGAVTNRTMIHFQPHSKGSTTSEFVIDDIEIRKVAYPYQDDAEHYAVGSDAAVADVSKLMLEPSTLVSVQGSSMTNLLNHGKALGIDRIDILLTTSYLYDTLGGDWTAAFAEAKRKLDDAGIEVWGIHLPYEEYGSKNIFDWCSDDASHRAEAIERMKRIIEACAVFEPQRLVTHPAGYNTDYGYYAKRDLFVKAMNELIPSATAAGAVLCVENLGNSYSTASSLTMKASYLNYFVSRCPGLKVCFDVTHATVKDINNASAFLAELGGNVAAVHIHGGDKSNDMHLFPGYSGLYSHADTINWGELYKTLVGTCGYRGPFTYELSTYEVDCIYNLNNLIHNYYDYVYPRFREQ